MQHPHWTAAATLVAAVALAACEPRDLPQPKTAVDAVSEKAKGRIEALKADARREFAEAREKARAVGDEARAAGAQASGDLRAAGGQVGDRVADAVITTAVHAELAKDGPLRAGRIDVDTDAGKVALRGSAPSEDARERAAQVAAQVKGVRSVDNQLSVEPAKM